MGKRRSLAFIESSLAAVPPAPVGADEHGSVIREVKTKERILLSTHPTLSIRAPSPHRVRCSFLYHLAKQLLGLHFHRKYKHK